ncbi:SHOCT domain-containing protein [Halorubrum sp. HHNYT27]|uniref:SHOCT domain-containing protein n=1 Tax=Halorubrum sp. HHNYT27 TaxID=3402275 RepID=UPI003EBC3519
MSTARTSGGLLRVGVIVLGVLLLFPILMMVFAMLMMGMMGWWDGGMMNGFSPLWGVGMLLAWLVVLLAIGYAIYRVLDGQVAPESGADPALEELRLAYARGDLTDEEFEERRQDLQQDE